MFKLQKVFRARCKQQEGASGGGGGIIISRPNNDSINQSTAPLRMCYRGLEDVKEFKVNPLPLFSFTLWNWIPIDQLLNKQTQQVALDSQEPISKFIEKCHRWFRPMTWLTGFFDRIQVQLPLVAVLCNPGLRKRHWQEMSALVGTDLVPNTGTTLRKFLRLSLMSSLEKYLASKTISAVSVNQLELIPLIQIRFGVFNWLPKVDRIGIVLGWKLSHVVFRNLSQW